MHINGSRAHETDTKKTILVGVWFRPRRFFYRVSLGGFWCCSAGEPALKVEVVTGVNLPMLVKLGSLQRRSLSLEELAAGITVAGQKSIGLASEFLHAKAST